MHKNIFFPEISGNFGFGCMRLPIKGEEVDTEEFAKMADAFVDAGFNYFDTAHGYIRGKSETAIREVVSRRYGREKFLLANKLSDPYFSSADDVRPFFESQLKLCGVDYFDFYLMHAQNRNNYLKFKECKAYETAFRLKEEGLVRHFCLSFHDRPEVLDMILTEHPEIEAVQIQFNYIDYDDPSVQARQTYEVCEKHEKPVIIMEPVKGGSLVNLPEAADNAMRALGGGSNASYAIRFAAGFPKVAMVLSGMSNFDQMADNLSAMTEFKPLDAVELEALAEVCRTIRSQKQIPCTDCRYCVEANTCPQDIQIPKLFAAKNTFDMFHNWNTRFYYNSVLTGEKHGKASDCIQCGMCESVCPQGLEIRKLLETVAETFEKR